MCERWRGPRFRAAVLVRDERQQSPVVASSIRPRRILGIHLPPSEVADMTKSLATVPDLTLLTTAGMRVGLR